MFKDKEFWIVTDANYLYIRSANYLGSQANGFMEFQIYGGTFPLR